MQDSTTSVKDEWSNYMERAECHYLEDTASVEKGKKEMEEVLQNWYVLLAYVVSLLKRTLCSFHLFEVFIGLSAYLNMYYAV